MVTANRPNSIREQIAPAAVAPGDGQQPGEEGQGAGGEFGPADQATPLREHQGEADRLIRRGLGDVGPGFRQAEAGLGAADGVHRTDFVPAKSILVETQRAEGGRHKQQGNDPQPGCPGMNYVALARHPGKYTVQARFVQ